MKLFRREDDLKRIRGFYHDTELIKVMTGVGRCQKGVAGCGEGSMGLWVEGYSNTCVRESDYEINYRIAV